MSSDNGNQFRIRTVTLFCALSNGVFEGTVLSDLLSDCAAKLRVAEQRLVKAGYEVQTIRIATNSFEEWLYEGDLAATDTARLIRERLDMLDSLLAEHEVNFCALGPAKTAEATRAVCPLIVETSPRFSCCADVLAGDVAMARAAADCIIAISRLGELQGAPAFLRGGLGNFRFCASSHCDDRYIPFFPAARSSSSDQSGNLVDGFALGMENGALAKTLLSKCRTLTNVEEIFRTELRDSLWPIQKHCVELEKDAGISFLGIDTSLNPSLDDGGSVAEAIESLQEVEGSFGSTGTLAAAAAITKSLQTLPDIRLCGYCGLMLPVCEDRRLAELASIEDAGTRLRISDLLCISSVCGVGVDTVPVPGNCSANALTSLILDVAGLAGRWNKPLSCRIFPVPDSEVFDMTEFDSPYMCNSCIFRLF